MAKYILALDQGTSSSRAILFDHEQNIISVAQREITQYYPRSGWVEHDAAEIYESICAVMREAMRKAGIGAEDILAAGITNQRETTVVWDRNTGKPVMHAIVWQCRRTAEYCDELRAKGLEDHIQNTTGLKLDAYFSATKLKWILDHVEGARRDAEQGKLLFGTIDSWLIWNLTGRKVHVTDYTNASRTMLYDIHRLCWDRVLLDEMRIPERMLPKVCDSSCVYGTMELDGREIPIAGIAGDQQASLFGQGCFQPYEAKNTYGTGCFLLMNTGNRVVHSTHGLLTTIAIGIDGKVEYALEGSIFIGGAVAQWLRDELGIIHDAKEMGEISESVPDNGGVYLVPAFAGLGAPYWDMYARGTIVGLTRGSGRAQIVRAAEESIAYQVMDLVQAIEKDCGAPLRELRVDGGACRDDFLMQFQADMLGKAIRRSDILETTALGAAYLAGLAVGFWKNKDEIARKRKDNGIFTASMDDDTRINLENGWHKAIRRSLNDGN